MPPVAVLVPSYQCAPFVADALNSLQAQEGLEAVREVILADGCSTDGTVEIARNTWNSSVPLRVVQPQRNQGEHADVNAAVASMGDVSWFLMMHADNMLRPGWLRALLDGIDEARPDTATISTSWVTLRPDGTLLEGDNDGGISFIEGTTAAVRDTLIGGCWWHNGSSANRVEAFRRTGMYPLEYRMKGDWDLLIRFLAGGWSVGYIPRSLMVYRDNPAGASGVTMKRHRDVAETLAIVRRYSWALSTRDLAAIHARQLGYLARRAAKSAMTRDPERLARTLPAAGLALRSLAVSLASRDTARPA